MQTAPFILQRLATLVKERANRPTILNILYVIQNWNQSVC